MGDRIDDFVALILSTPGVHATVDRPNDPTGTSFIDIAGPGVATQVSFQPSVGFGLFLTNDAFGQRPDVLIQEPSVAAEQLLATGLLATRSKVVAGD